MKRKMLAGIVGAGVIAGAAFFALQEFAGNASADDLQAAVDARRALMKDNIAKMKATGAVVEAKSGDLAAMQQLALGLQSNAEKMVDLFPKGSSMTDLPGKTNAKPEIWDNFDDFKSIAATFATESGKLADAAKSGDMSAFAAQYDVVGEKGCGGCHTKYRMKQQ
jgi:cytochrome c556